MKQKPKITGTMYAYAIVHYKGQAYYPLVPIGYDRCKDNSKWCKSYSGGHSGSCMWIRVPRLNASVSEWRKFYKLFPYVYAAMLEQRADDQEVVTTSYVYGNGKTVAWKLKYVTGLTFDCLDPYDRDRFGHCCDEIRLKKLTIKPINFETL